MFEQAPDGYGFGSGASVIAPPPPAYELRPLSLGEILDRTFSLYRKNFWLYCGLSALAAALTTITQIVQVIWLGIPVKGATAASITQSGSPKTALIASAVTLVVALIYFVGYAYIQAATTSAVSSIYLGHETSMSIALKAVRPTWYRFVLIAFWQAWSALWIPLVLLIVGVVAVARSPILGGFILFVAFGSLIYGLIAYIRNSLAIAASVLEGSKVRASMRRSKVLAVENKWRIFLVLLLMYVLNLAAGMLQLPFAFMLLKSPGGQRFMAEGMSLLVAFVTTSLIGPVGAIALCLMYIDSRVRKEGFDIEALMDRTLGAPMRVPVEAPPVMVGPGGFAPSGFTAETPFAPSGFTSPAAPFAPSGFTAPVETSRTDRDEPA